MEGHRTNNHAEPHQLTVTPVPYASAPLGVQRRAGQGQDTRAPSRGSASELRSLHCLCYPPIPAPLHPCLPPSPRPRRLRCRDSPTPFIHSLTLHPYPLPLPLHTSLSAGRLCPLAFAVGTPPPPPPLPSHCRACVTPTPTTAPTPPLPLPRRSAPCRPGTPPPSGGAAG